MLEPHYIFDGPLDLQEFALGPWTKAVILSHDDEIGFDLVDGTREQQKIQVDPAARSIPLAILSSDLQPIQFNANRELTVDGIRPVRWSFDSLPLDNPTILGPRPSQTGANSVRISVVADAYAAAWILRREDLRAPDIIPEHYLLLLTRSGELT